MKIQNIQNKEQILRAAKEKGKVTYKGKSIRITPDFSMEIKNPEGSGKMCCRH